MGAEYKPFVQPQRILNLTMKEVVKKEVLKLLDASMIYPISYSTWVSLVHVVPKKGGMTVVANEKKELITTHTVTGWRMCIDYRMLNQATRKDHFPLPFMDQMIESWLAKLFIAFWMDIRGIIRLRCLRTIKKRMPSLVHLVCLLIGECPLGCVMRRRPFKCVCSTSSLT
ncbi:reverse transcriptase, putative [Medicago truncatula]|uniref:Reverse transcriptase, putative n=1 Tax=Medicago truncatula TaxID=3880 RepID=A0A072U9I7_MEDTR|nr:reverse transcriptase, putative [Medicago truncatula]